MRMKLAADVATFCHYSFAAPAGRIIDEASAPLIAMPISSVTILMRW